MISPAARAALFASLLLMACGGSEFSEYRLSGATMGTQFSVAVVTGRDFDHAAVQTELQQEILALLDTIDARMSTYRADSELAQFNRLHSTDWVSVSPQLCSTVARALETSVRTGGAFDITVGPAVDLWGFGPDPARNTPPADQEIAAAQALTGFERLHVDCDQPAIRKDLAEMRIDLSGFAKGLAADDIAGLLEGRGIGNFLVDIGGDLLVRGHNADRQPWRIAIEKPDSAGRAIEKIVHLSHGAVATSGDYRNYFEAAGRRYSHTIDPQSARPIVHKLASASVHAASAAEADGLATALMVLGPDAGLAFAEREGLAAFLLVRTDGGFSELSSTAFRALAER
jgi:thiamine biosynthesis lipoprotein